MQTFKTGVNKLKDIFLYYILPEGNEDSGESSLNSNYFSSESSSEVVECKDDCSLCASEQRSLTMIGSKKSVLSLQNHNHLE